MHCEITIHRDFPADSTPSRSAGAAIDIVLPELARPGLEARLGNPGQMLSENLSANSPASRPLLGRPAVAGARSRVSFWSNPASMRWAAVPDSFTPPCSATTLPLRESVTGRVPLPVTLPLLGSDGVTGSQSPLPPA